MSNYTPIKPSPVDDDSVRAFIDGWNAAKSGEHGDDFDMALHWWMREQCGIGAGFAAVVSEYQSDDA